ncbi:MAG: hypothetical protein SH818_11325 [Saprospiraceae bacterium]|nr:hypothetical protein [Saprospiraceae bacterium]
MKNILTLLTILFFSITAYSQSIFSKWPALDEYHKVMAQTFHPSEDGNLEPIKKRSGELKTQAGLVAKSTIPTDFDSPAIRKAVKHLNKDSKALDKVIQSNKATDPQITKSLAALHDVFHDVVGLCKDEKH